LSASLGKGLVWESSVEKAVAKNAEGSAGIRGLSVVLPVDAQLGGSRSVAVTESEVRKQTQESIFNAVRHSLEANDLLRRPSSPWADAEWSIGEFVDFTSERIVVPLVSVFSRVRVIAEAFAFATTELSSQSLQTHIPQLFEQMRGGESNAPRDDSPDFDTILSLIREIGELARAVAGVIRRLEDEADASGLVDVVMFERHTTAAPVVVVASLDREYVDTKLLRRLGQGTFGVLGKVVRTPEPGTAFNAFRNSMLGATNQLPVLLTRLVRSARRTAASSR
jgi:hypothetical protein